MHLGFVVISLRCVHVAFSRKIWPQGGVAVVVVVVAAVVRIVVEEDERP